MQKYLTTKEVAKRWGGVFTEKTIRTWRSPKCPIEGPPFIVMGGKIVYPLDDLELWEKRHMRMTKLDETRQGKFAPSVLPFPAPANITTEPTGDPPCLS